MSLSSRMPLTLAASLDGAALGLLARPPKGPYTHALRSLRLSVRTPDFQSGKTSSILVGITTILFWNSIALFPSHILPAISFTSHHGFCNDQAVSKIFAWPATADMRRVVRTGRRVPNPSHGRGNGWRAGHQECQVQLCCAQEHPRIGMSRKGFVVMRRRRLVRRARQAPDPQGSVFPVLVRT